MALAMIVAMGTVERSKDRGSFRGERWISLLAREFRTARLIRGLSQKAVAQAVGISRPGYSAVELGRLKTISIMVASRIAAVLGLDLFVALYPGERGLRDAASARLIRSVVEHVGAPLRYRTEVPLPTVNSRPDQRRWDLVVQGDGKRTAFEFETRLHDAQAQMGRINLKRRDDPTDGFVLIVADTRRNREALREFPELFADLAQLPTAATLRSLEAGLHPTTGLVLLRAPAANPRSTATDPSKTR